MSYTTPARKTISLVIPAWNEEQFLPRLLDSVAAAIEAYSPGESLVEVLVADNGSTDRTAEIARERGYRVVPVAKRCIAAARNGGAHQATGEVVAFADADFRLHPATFSVINALMARSEIIGGGTGITMERWSLGIYATWWAILPLLWLAGFDGGVWFCRRDDFQLAGGYDESIRAAEDVKFLRALQKLGKSRTPSARLATHFTAKRYGLEPAIVLNSTRKFDKHGDWHMFRDVICNAPQALFSRGVLERYIERYWYQDRTTPRA